MKKVLITGSTQGIGKSIAKRLIDEGYDVIIHCRNDLNKAENIRKELGGFKAVACDLSNMQEVNEIKEKTGDVDILILNASVQYKEQWFEISDENIDKQINLNVKSTLKLMQIYYPYMKEQCFGRIITIGSVNQKNNHPELSLYGATKNAVLYLVENIAKQVAPYGITINNVAPGAIVTPRNANVYENETLRRLVEDKIPMGRFGSPDEIAGCVAMLCGKDGDYITGANIFIDGGMGL